MTQKKILPGLEAEIAVTVSEKDTAVFLGSGQRAVLGTPALVALLEAAAQAAVASLLAAGEETVGISLELTHTGATPMGMRVTAKARLTSVEGRNLIFAIEAYDEFEKIAEGCHVRTLAATRSLERLLLKKLKT